MPRRQREDNSQNNTQANGTPYRADRPALQIASNELFIKYYRDVNSVILNNASSAQDAASSSSAPSWDSFVKYLESPLRQTFWINDTDPLAEIFAKELSVVGGSNVEPIPWYPFSVQQSSSSSSSKKLPLAWRVTASKEAFRHEASVQPLRQLMIRLTALGITSRQEEVSMIPPLLLEIQKNDKCLDMCAAPGSKTAQMLVGLGRNHQQATETEKSSLPFDYIGSSGLVMANEIDEKRSNMLVHQCKRIRSLFPFAVFTNHDARYLPNVVGANTNHNNNNTGGEFFDKVLCDVMCSGDGTLRKAPALLRSWRPFDAAQLQKSQVQVALRGCHLLKVGGRLVYSTCSLNPIENEAVVSQILLRTNGALELLDPRSMLPGLQCDPGMKTWKVMRNDGSIVTEGPDAKMKEGVDENNNKKNQQQLHPALFPVPGKDFGLEKCMRLMPHHCEGGGFFVAVFKKVSSWQIVTAAELQRQRGGEEQTSSSSAATTSTTAAKQDINDEQRDNNKKDDDEDVIAIQPAAEVSSAEKKFTPVPLLPFLSPAKDLVDNEIIESLTIDEKLLPRSNFFSRAPAIPSDPKSEQQKQDIINNQQKEFQTAPIQIVSSGVRDLIIQGVRNPNLRISACGLRGFVSQPGLSGMLGWRISNEASNIVAPALKDRKRVVSATLDDVLPMINEESGSKLKDITFDKIKNEKFKKAVEEELPIGCFLLKISSPHRPENDDGKYDVICPALRARSRIQLLVDAEDMQGLRCRLGIELAKEN